MSPSRTPRRTRRPSEPTARSPAGPGASASGSARSSSSHLASSDAASSSDEETFTARRDRSIGRGGGFACWRDLIGAARLDFREPRVGGLARPVLLVRARFRAHPVRDGQFGLHAPQTQAQGGSSRVTPWHFAWNHPWHTSQSSMKSS